MKIPVIIQLQPGESGAAALCMMLGFYKKYVPLSVVREKTIASRNGTSPEQLLQAAERFALTGSIRTVEKDDLVREKLPLLVQWKKRYYCIIKKIRPKTITVLDPARGEVTMTREKFDELFTGTVIDLTPSHQFCPGGKPVSIWELISGRLKANQSAIILIVLLSTISSLFGVLSLNPTKNFIDNVLKERRMDLYLPLLIAMTAFLLVQTIMSAFKTQLVAKASRKTAAMSGAALCKKLFSLPLRYFENHSAGELMQRIENNITVNRTLLNSAVPRIVDAAMTVLYITLLFTYNWKIASICLIVEALYLMVSWYNQTRIAIVNRSVMTSSGSLDASLLNGLGTIETIKSSGTEQSFYEIWTDSQDQFSQSFRSSIQTDAVTTAIGSLHTLFSQAVILFAGAIAIYHGNLTVGEFAVFDLALTNARNYLGNCISSINTMQSMRTNIERVEDINEQPSDPQIPLDEENPAIDKIRGRITVSNVSYRYHSGDEPAVSDVSFSVEPGQIVAIVGESGCGKSTLLKMIEGFYRPTSGEILYDGKKREEIADVVFTSSMANVDQDSMIFEDTVRTNLTLWDDTIEPFEMLMAARDAQIHDRIMENPEQYYATVLENGRNYSGGEQQRMELARALARVPTILCLDEFTSALDALTEERIFKAIRMLNVTCLLVAHRLSTISGCDRIYVMDHGKIVESGTHEELYQKGGLYHELLKVE